MQKEVGPVAAAIHSNSSNRMRRKSPNSAQIGNSPRTGGSVAVYTKRQQLHEHEVSMDRPDETVSRGFLGAGVSRVLVPISSVEAASKVPKSRALYF